MRRKGDAGWSPSSCERLDIRDAAKHRDQKKDFKNTKRPQQEWHCMCWPHPHLQTLPNTATFSLMWQFSVCCTFAHLYGSSREHSGQVNAVMPGPPCTMEWLTSSRICHREQKALASEQLSLLKSLTSDLIDGKAHIVHILAVPIPAIFLHRSHEEAAGSFIIIILLHQANLILRVNPEVVYRDSRNKASWDIESYHIQCNTQWQHVTCVHLHSVCAFVHATYYKLHQTWTFTICSD